MTINTSAFVFCRHPEPALGCPTELCHVLLISSGADKNESSGADPDEKRYKRDCRAGETAKSDSSRLCPVPLLAFCLRKHLVLGPATGGGTNKQHTVV